MATFEEFVSGLVILVGLVGWVVFIPQIRLLTKIKDSRSISLGMIWGSLLMQIILFTNSFLRKDWPMAFTMLTSLSFLFFTICLVHYYRRWPGGQKAQKGG